MISLVFAGLLLAQVQVPMGETKQEFWNATVNYMPIVPKGGPFLIVSGKMVFPTTGYKAELVLAKPQGFNHKILVLEVKVTPPPPNAPTLQQITTIPVQFRAKYSHESVEVRFGKQQFSLKIDKLY